MWQSFLSNSRELKEKEKLGWNDHQPWASEKYDCKDGGATEKLYCFYSHYTVSVPAAQMQFPTTCARQGNLKLDLWIWK